MVLKVTTYSDLSPNYTISHIPYLDTPLQTKHRSAVVAVLAAVASVVVMVVARAAAAIPRTVTTAATATIARSCLSLRL